MLKPLRAPQYGGAGVSGDRNSHVSLPCGYHGNAEKNCTCSANVVARYQKRISGQLLDRIDIHVDVPRVNYEKLSGQR